MKSAAANGYRRVYRASVPQRLNGGRNPAAKMDEALAAYEHARQVYRNIIAESDTD